jgi:hypothetical protein
MAYSRTWLLELLEDIGLKVAEQPGHRTLGHGDIGTGPCCYAARLLRRNMPRLGIVTKGHPQLPQRLRKV